VSDAGLRWDGARKAADGNYYRYPVVGVTPEAPHVTAAL